MIDKITNKDYITITADGVTVGGKPTKTYRGEQIECVEDLPGVFQDIQRVVQEEYGGAPVEMRVMSSKTSGNYAKPGKPSPKHGSNSWVSFVFAKGVKTRWVFRYSHPSESHCAGGCAFYCGSCVRDTSPFRSDVFGSVADAIFRSGIFGSAIKTKKVNKLSMKEWVHDNSLALMLISLMVAEVLIVATASYGHRVKKQEKSINKQVESYEKTLPGYLEQKQKVEHYRDSLMHEKRL